MKNLGEVVLVVLLLRLGDAKEWPCLRVTNMVFYIHTKLTSPNATDVVVAGGFGFNFGTVSVGDLVLSKEQAENSSQVGRLKIMVLNADTTYTLYPHAQEFMTAVIETEKYNGTFAINGRDIADGSELAIVGGTGYFRGVKGWANFTHVEVNPPDSTTYVNATLFHPPSSWFSNFYEEIKNIEEELRPWTA